MTRLSAGLFEGPAPRWFTIPAHRPFVEDLASGLHAALSPQGPEALADAIVLTPTRRAARALAEAFSHAAGGRPLLLPQIRALGDLAEGEPPFEPGDLTLDLPPAIGPYRRRFELARLVAEHAGELDRDLDASAALELADALGALIDSAQIEEVEDLAGLEGLVSGDFARHWERSARFLGLAAEAWPARLCELGLVDVSQRRVALLRALAERWRSEPPQGVLIAAGSTGTAPATADLLHVIASAPRGATVLPGLDLDLAEDAWLQVDEQHPQGAMKRLLDRAQTTRSAVNPWPVLETPPEQSWGRSRRRLINEALRPADATADWIGQIVRLREERAPEGVDPVAQGLEGLSLVAARNEEEAASVIALLLREALETPGKTAALVTPDQALGRRVSARLTRWNVAADVSAGAALLTFPVGALSAAVARLSARPLEPATLLAVLKHPLVRLGLPTGVKQRRVTLLERHALRGPRPRDWAAVQAKLSERAARAEPDFADRLKEAGALAVTAEAALSTAAAVFAGGAADAAETARAHVQALEILAADAEGGTGELWAGGEEAAAGLLAALIEESAGLPPVTAGGYADLVERLLAGETVRTGGATHPRLRILGAIEARLVRADRLILAGLEEGVWPAGAPTDPFLSRPMRKRLGLPPPERRVGLSAHDFAQAACAPEVVLLHAERRGGQPAVPSRWLWRLQTLVAGASAPDHPVSFDRRPEILEHARALDAPAAFRPARRPRPKPPVEARPRELSVTRIETWVRDPYSIYARYILGLKTLDRPDHPVEASARGSAVHAAFERFVQDHPVELPDNVSERFESLLLEELRRAGMGDEAMARETPLARNAALWAGDLERRRRAGCKRLIVEQTGAMTVPGPAGDFRLTAKADRIEISDCGHVLDFKTGAAPSLKQVRLGLAPQLTLTAAILRAGGFAEAGSIAPGELIYVRVTGRREAIREELRAERHESAALADAALEGLTRRVAAFDRSETDYRSWAMPQFLKDRGGDYDHLARLWEWYVISADEEDEVAP